MNPLTPIFVITILTLGFTMIFVLTKYLKLLTAYEQSQKQYDTLHIIYTDINKKYQKYLDEDIRVRLPSPKDPVIMTRKQIADSCRKAKEADMVVGITKAPEGTPINMTVTKNTYKPQ